MKKLSFIFISLLLITSCVKEVIEYPKVNGDEDITYTAGYLQVQVQNPDVSTRSATWTYDNYFPNAEITHRDSKHERWRHNLSLAYFDSDFILEHFSTPGLTDYTKDPMVAVDVYESSNTLGYTSFTLGISSLPITTGVHYFYILANLPPDYMYALRDYCTQRVGELNKDDFEKLVIEDFTNSNKDYTVEELACVPLFTTGNEYKPRSIMTNITSPAPHYLGPYTLMVGNVSYPAMNNLEMNIGKSFAKISVAYIPSHTSSNLTEIEYRIVNDPKKTYLLPNIFKGQVHTPHYDYDGQITDDNFETYFETYFNPNSHIHKTFTDSTNFSWRPATLDPDQNKAFAYCLENGNKTPLQGNSTMVLVKARYKPSQWLNPDDSPGSESQDHTFWRIRNTSGKYLSGYYNAKPQVGSNQEAVEYREGITYYPIWLQTEGKYMVERNHYYKIAITEVLSAGAPDLASVMTPTTPLDDSTDSASTKTRNAGSENNLPEVAKCIRWEQKN